ncbi:MULTISPECIES: YqkE family protein [unclassified Paenibacillus]|uniref:YqkE family protein n=1 Tax=unclassified Paenibacillus TaxID=185978 RepID=UPI0011A93857|nr:MULTISPECIES: YqkE family protein [Paenibacillaceae]
MAKKRRQASPSNRPSSAEQPATLKDLLSSEMVDKLKAQANEIKAEEEKRKEEERKKAEQARKVEQERLDNDFEHLLKNSNMDWRKYK